MYFLGITWNPDDTLFKLGFLQIKYYNLLWIVAFVVGWFIMKRIFFNEKRDLKQLDALFIYTVLSTMLGARLGHVFFYDWSYYKNHLVEILLPVRERAGESLFGLINGYEFTGFTGLASHGAAIGVIIGMYLLSRKHKELKMMWVLDRLVIPVALGAFCVRLGNFFNSEINGKITDASFLFATKFVRDSDDMPAGKVMAITGENTPDAAYAALETNPKFAEFFEAIPFRHPAQLYEGVAYIFVFLILYFLYWKTDKKDKPGYLFGLFLVLLWTVRFFVEFVKKSQGGFEESLGLLSTGQWLSLPFILIGLFFMFKPVKASS
ncbi:prolipoprotein diacylglyceryl transferase [Lentiprolixibacter aurantiacus]|uniref:Phosphatidylglycerol--prolipoprotein diacylglyceryl transferase n=1 Tax=Lentiprolixibacter aurantiacus TaxID=2993939 RepID=A0AAE3SP88_9FLAO|nr:prolipoprotein diacylglyceryl transferase [Lentiprolixibacter aurantiacus]MCX2720582.1 prolipoprotein diacylglyceryl transferase [Lentiprolixibacter aurantiacus]